MIPATSSSLDGMRRGNAFARGGRVDGEVKIPLDNSFVIPKERADFEPCHLFECDDRLFTDCGVELDEDYVEDIEGCVACGKKLCEGCVEYIVTGRP